MNLIKLINELSINNQIISLSQLNFRKNQTVQVKYTYPIEVYTYKFCPRFPFSCKTKKTEYRVGIRPENKTIINTIKACCDGYFQESDKCKPFCPNTCVHGECSAPGVCDCQPGSGGISCNVTCPATKWGINCEYDCGEFLFKFTIYFMLYSYILLN